VAGFSDARFAPFRAMEGVVACDGAEHSKTSSFPQPDHKGSISMNIRATIPSSIVLFLKSQTSTTGVLKPLWQVKEDMSPADTVVRATCHMTAGARSFRYCSGVWF